MQPGRDRALVTGASSGIGAEFARQLAARRIDLIVTARRLERLEALAAELRGRYGVQVACVANDLSEDQGAHRLVRDLDERGLSPTVLVNNAGLGIHGPFLDLQPAEIEAQLRVNVGALTTLCHLLGPRMAQERHGYILNVASFGALAPIPYYAVYSATKAYVVAFTQALAHELAPQGVRVGVVCPGFTPTEFFDVAGHQKTALMRATETTVPQVVRAALRGLDRGRLLTVPGWWYRLSGLGARLLPRRLISSISAKMVRS